MSGLSLGPMLGGRADDDLDLLPDGLERVHEVALAAHHVEQSGAVGMAARRELLDECLHEFSPLTGVQILPPSIIS